jgi:hypothetical protein
MDSKNVFTRGTSVSKDGQAHDMVFARKSDGKVILKIDGTNGLPIVNAGIIKVSGTQTMIDGGTYLANASAGNITLSLPLSKQSIAGVTVINVGASGTVTVGLQGSDGIGVGSGASSVALTSGQANTFVPDGVTYWHIKSAS